MTDQGGEIAFRLRVRRGPRTDRWWLVVPLEVGRHATLAMVPNTVAGRSVITPAALQLLRAAGLPGADIGDFRSGRRDYLLRDVRLGGRSVPDVRVPVRHVAGLQVAGERG